MTEAAIVTWPGILTTPLVQSMKILAFDFDVRIIERPLIANSDGKSHYKLLQQYKNVISWTYHGANCEQQNRERNTLYFENGLLVRGKTYYLDDNGYNSCSNIVLRKYNVQTYDDETKKFVVNKLIENNFIFRSENTYNGCILIGLQGNYLDRKLLRNCIKFLPKTDLIVVRPHPGQIEKCYEVFEENCKELSNFVFDTEKDAFKSLMRCDALIVNNSSLMYKAMCMGKKVAACERGFHTNSRAVLDCSINPQLLSNIYDFAVDSDAVMNLICGIYLQSVSSQATTKDLLYNTNFTNWLIRIRR